MVKTKNSTTIQFSSEQLLQQPFQLLHSSCHQGAAIFLSDACQLEVNLFQFGLMLPNLYNLLNVFTLKETICPRICSKSLLKSGKSPLLVDMNRSKLRLNLHLILSCFKTNGSPQVAGLSPRIGGCGFPYRLL